MFNIENDPLPDIRTYLEDQNTSDACSSSAANAWLEYADKYPQRIKKKVICDECGDEIRDLNAGLIACTDFGNFFEIVHMNCRDERTRWQIQLDAIRLTETLRDFFQQNAIPRQIVDALEEQLRLAGFVLTPPPKSLVYFIESQPSGAIKIGYSGSLRQAEQRRKALQIARHPETLRIKAVIDGDLKFEDELQCRFEAHNLGGEWFSPHPELLEFIAASAYDPYDKQ